MGSVGQPPAQTIARATGGDERSMAGWVAGLLWPALLPCILPPLLPTPTVLYRLLRCPLPTLAAPLGQVGRRDPRPLARHPPLARHLRLPRGGRPRLRCGGGGHSGPRLTHQFRLPGPPPR